MIAGRTLVPKSSIEDIDVRECLAIQIARRIAGGVVIEMLFDAMAMHGVSVRIRADNSPEMTSNAEPDWFSAIGVHTLFIEPGCPWGNGYNESFNGKLCDECLSGETFNSLEEAKIVIEKGWRIYNARRPYSSLGYRPPAPLALTPKPMLIEQRAVMQ